MRGAAVEAEELACGIEMELEKARWKVDAGVCAEALEAGGGDVGGEDLGRWQEGPGRYAEAADGAGHRSASRG